MKSEIKDQLINQGLAALWIMGAGDHNPNMVYFTGLHHISKTNLFILKDKEPILLHNPMEREEARQTGLQTIDMSNYPLSEFMKLANADLAKAQGLLFQKLFTDIGLTRGKVALSGVADVGGAFGLINEIQKFMPELEFSGILEDDPFEVARMTKEPDEIERIRTMGKITTEIVGMIADFLSNLTDKDGVLVEDNGQPVTIADVKNKLKLWLAERNAEAPEEIIFAQGRDAGIPHSAGNPQEVLRTGVPIVFDFFPCEAGGGYFYDFTRTWCIGHAPREVQDLYDQVLQVYQTLVGELVMNTPFSQYQQRTCELFAQMGHATILETPATEEGYVHSVGHGIGLAIHEEPHSGAIASQMSLLKPGVTFTLEPGLYYPSRGMGVRLEDSYVATPQGTFEKLAEYPLDLVIPLKKK